MLMVVGGAGSDLRRCCAVDIDAGCRTRAGESQVKLGMEVAMNRKSDEERENCEGRQNDARGKDDGNYQDKTKLQVCRKQQARLYIHQ